MRVIAGFLFFASLAPAEPFDHSEWNAILRTRVNDIGEVDYAGLKASPEPLKRYIAALAAASPDSAPKQFPERSHALAYWINAYNAFTIQGALDSYPLESIRKVDKFFGKRAHRAGGQDLSLDDIEHEILRGKYREPRIHFAIVCASVSCPALWDRAFDGEKLDKQLDARAREFVNQRRNLDADVDRKTITLSKIFDWFEEDFEAATGLKGPTAVLAFVRPYAAEPLLDALSRLTAARTRYFPYDWRLNQTGSRAASSNHFEVELSSESSAKP
jgi:hypothetical protein